MKLIILLIPLLLVSCSNYVGKWHNQIDRDLAIRQDRYKMGPKSNQNFNLYRRNLPANNRFSNEAAPISTKNNLHSTKFTRNLNPVTKRQYTPENKVRIKANDLLDNDNEGSLWVGAGQDNYLFSRNNSKRHGDIVVINVQSKLKKDITLELSRAFPDMMKKKKDQNKKGEGEQEEKKDAADADNEDLSDPNKVYDKISSVIIEEINQDHLLLRGRKDVLFKKKKRLVEVQALVARRDISDDDAVLSGTVIESSISVLR